MQARKPSTGALCFAQAAAAARSPRKAYETQRLTVVCMQRITVLRDRVEIGTKYKLLWY